MAYKYIILIACIFFSFSYGSRHQHIGHGEHDLIKKFDVKYYSFGTSTKPYNSIESEHFVLYWGTKNPGTIAWNDTNKNGQADFIDTIMEASEHSVSKIKELGFHWPFEDKVEILVANTDLYENSKAVILDSDTIGLATNGRIYLNGNINGSPYPALTPPLDLLKITIGHEILHIFQLSLRKDFSPTNIWLYEGTAVWAERYLYPEIFDYVYLYGEDLPDSIKAGLGSNSGFNPYATGFFFWYLTQKYDHFIIKEMFDYFAINNTKNGLFAVDEALKARGSSLLMESSYFYDYLKNENDDEGIQKLKSYLSSKYITLFQKSNVSCDNYSKNFSIRNFAYMEMNDNCQQYLITTQDSGMFGYKNSIYIGKGLNIYNNKTHFIQAFDNFGTYYDNYAKISKIVGLNQNPTITLKSGWNMVSSKFDIDLDNINLENIEIIWNYENGDWKLYANGLFNNDLGYDTIDKLYANIGYWIRVTNDTVISIDSSDSGYCSFDTIDKGWTFWANSCNMDLEFTNLGFGYLIIWGYENNQWFVKTDSSIVHNYPYILEKLKNGMGYWIFK